MISTKISVHREGEKDFHVIKITMNTDTNTMVGAWYLNNEGEWVPKELGETPENCVITSKYLPESS